MRKFINIVNEAFSGATMAMGGTIFVLNGMVQNNIIKKYAIAGAVAAFYYIEPAVTMDLDILVALELSSRSGLITLGPIVSYLNKLGYNEWNHEGIMIEDWAVQFLPVADALDKEALEQAILVNASFNDGEHQTWILRAEHLIAKALMVGRLKDYSRIEQFFEFNAIDLVKLNEVIHKFSLQSQWKRFTNKSEMKDPLEDML